MLKELQNNLQKLANPNQAKLLQRFFKTAKGEYGEGDIFLGLKVPQLRVLAKKYMSLSLNDVQIMLNGKFHEYRMTGLLILVYKYKKADAKLKTDIYNLYIKNYNNINNWDLVDVTCPHIVGDYLLNKDRKILYQFAKSNHLWKKRIAMITCLAFIREKDFTDIIKLADILLHDQHDLIHKAVGWMLREAGKHDQKLLEAYLNRNYKTMPRTMLRYAIEKLPESKRQHYLRK
ncbi:MAG: DNA alkylation repair protein [Patescibacteria group bacterium]